MNIKRKNVSCFFFVSAFSPSFESKKWANKWRNYFYWFNLDSTAISYPFSLLIATKITSHNISRVCYDPNVVHNWLLDSFPLWNFIHVWLVANVFMVDFLRCKRDNFVINLTHKRALNYNVICNCDFRSVQSVCFNTRNFDSIPFKLRNKLCVKNLIFKMETLVWRDTSKIWGFCVLDDCLFLLKIFLFLSL